MTAQKTGAAPFTPGPWNTERPYGEPGLYIAGPDTSLVAKLYEPSSFAEANARLIAAAPSLYAALVDCLGDLGHYASTHGPGPDRRLEQAREAIRLVGGE